MVVAADPDLERVFVLVDDREDGVFLVPEGAVVEVAQQLEVVVVGTDQRVAGEDAGHLRRAAGAQAGKGAVQPIVEGGVGNPDRRVLNLGLVGDAAVIQPVERTQRAQGKPVAMTGGIVDVQGPAEAIGARIGAAGVVAVDAARKAPARRQGDVQVRGADRLAGAEG